MPGDDLSKRLAKIPLDELRQYIDAAISHIRARRNALVVHAGMTIEQTPGPIPELDLGGVEAQRVFEQLMERIPLSHESLIDEEPAQLEQPTAAERAQVKELMERLAEDPEAFQELVDETGADLTYEQVVAIRDSLYRADMFAELHDEIAALRDELVAYREHMSEQSSGLLDILMSSRKLIN